MIEKKRKKEKVKIEEINDLNGMILEHRMIKSILFVDINTIYNITIFSLWRKKHVRFENKNYPLI